MSAADTIAAVRAALRAYPSAKPLKTAADAQREALKAARAAGAILIRDLPGMGPEDVKQVTFEAVRAINRAALDAAERMQRTRAVSYGEENLGVVRPEFRAGRARHLAEHADSVFMADELTEEAARGFEATLEQNAVLCIDDAERGLAAARYEMGKKSVIVRTAMGANSCEWCLSVAGEYEYGPGMDKTAAFGRHANCDCVIEYQPGVGRVETVRNYRLSDKEMQRLKNAGE